MRSPGKAALTTWAVLTVASLASPGTASAQFFGGGLGRLGGGMGGGLPGLGGLFGGGMSGGSPWQGGGQGRGGLFGNYGNSGNYGNYGPTSPGYVQPYSYPSQGYPNSRPAPVYSNSQPVQGYSSSGQPYLATDGKWYYPDGRPYTPPARPATRPAITTAAPAVTAAPAATAPATPAANVIPDLDGAASIANNTVRAQVPSASATVQNDLARELARSLAEGIDRLEGSLRDALFSEADEANFLAIYKRAFTEDTPQFRLARKNIKYLDAGELRQGLEIDGIVDAGAQIYPAKLEVSAGFGTFKRAILDGQSPAEFDRAVKGLLKTYEAVSRLPEFGGLSIPPLDQFRAEVAGLRQLFEVRQQVATAKEPAPGERVPLEKQFRVVRYPGLPKDSVQAIDPQVCLWGTGAGRVEIQDAELVDLGVPLLKPDAFPLADTPRGAAPGGVLVQNPRNNKVKVNYVVDGVSYELKPGESRPHALGANSQITYNRGGTLGNVTYRLSAGTYRFSIQARAWQVTKTTFSVVIDNSANGCAFHCEVDGQPRTIPPHGTLPLSSNYPIAIRFDRVNGQATASKLLGDESIVTVGVAPGSAALDLFSGKGQELAVRPPRPESIASQANTATATATKPGRQSILPTVDDLQ